MKSCRMRINNNVFAKEKKQFTMKLMKKIKGFFVGCVALCPPVYQQAQFSKKPNVATPNLLTVIPAEPKREPESIYIKRNFHKVIEDQKAINHPGHRAHRGKKDQDQNRFTTKLMKYTKENQNPRDTMLCI